MTRARLLTGALFLYLILASFYVIAEAWGRFSGAWSDPLLDFDVFYEAGRSVLGQGRPDLYTEDDSLFYPPLYALAYAPLAALDEVDAFRLHSLINLLAAGGFVWLAWQWGARRSELAAVGLAAASFTPLVDSLVWGQPAPVLALLGGAALLLYERRPDSPLTWLTTALLVLKPPLLTPPLGLWAALRRWRPFIATAVLAALLLAVPFVFLGWGQAERYWDDATAITSDSFAEEAGVTAAAATLFNWNGVVARVWRESPPIAVTLALDLLTLVLAYKAIRASSLREGWLVATAAMLLVTPHVHFHQWLVLFPPVIAVYLDGRHPATLALLIAFHFALVLTVVFWGVGVLSGIWAPALLGVIVYFAFREWLEPALTAVLTAIGLTGPPRRLTAKAEA